MVGEDMLTFVNLALPTTERHPPPCWTGSACGRIAQGCCLSQQRGGLRRVLGSWVVSQTRTTSESPCMKSLRKSTYRLCCLRGGCGTQRTTEGSKQADRHLPCPVDPAPHDPQMASPVQQSMRFFVCHLTWLIILVCQNLRTSMGRHCSSFHKAQALVSQTSTVVGGNWKEPACGA